jgi:hypothetical protein
MKEIGTIKRGHDQIMQAVRSGKQNHAYGVSKVCMASGTCSGCLYATEIFVLDWQEVKWRQA